MFGKKVSEAEVLKALSRVQDPDLHKDIVTLGFIKNLKIDGSTVSFDINLTTPACPVRDKMKDQARQAVLELDGVRDVNINLTAEVRQHFGMDRSALSGVRNIVAIGSGKGGVGKSTVAANVAVGLAMTGANVGLVDADIYGPTIPIMLGLRREAQIKNSRIMPLEQHGIKFISMGLFVPGDKPLIWRGPMAHKALQQCLFDVEWGELDYLIVDLPPGCLSADTLIFTEQGPVPISEMKEGLLVYSFDGHFNKASYKSPRGMHAALVKRKVLAVIPQGKATVYELKTATRSIKGTADHPMLAVRRWKRENTRIHDYSLEWVGLGDLKPGDIILIIKKVPGEPGTPLRLPQLASAAKTPLNLPEYASDDFMRLVGYFLGDGSVRTSNGNYWGVWFSEPEDGKYRSEYVHRLKSVFGLTHIHQQPSRFAAISAPIAELFERLGLHEKALSKRIPNWAFSLPPSQQLALIEGYCDADGHRRAPKSNLRRPGWMVFESPNKRLMEDLRALCVYAGLKVDNLRCRTRTIRVPSTRQLLTQTFWGFDGNTAAKTDLYGAGLIRGSVGRGLRHDYIGFERVREVRLAGVEEVYDLHVEGEHNFIADGFIVHNTGDVHLTLVQSVPVTGAVIVSTPQDVGLTISMKTLRMFQQTNVPVLGIIENMSYHVCSHCGAREEIFGHGGARAASESLGVPFLGEIPIDVKIRMHADSGTPIVLAEPDSASAKAYREILEQLAAQVSIQNYRTTPLRIVEVPV